MKTNYRLVLIQTETIYSLKKLLFATAVTHTGQTALLYGKLFVYNRKQGSRGKGGGGTLAALPTPGGLL